MTVPTLAATATERRQAAPDRLSRRALSPIEEGLLFPEFYGSGGRYVEQIVCNVLGSIDYGKVERTIARLVQKHEILRTCYAKEGGNLCARVYRTGKAAVAVVDLSGERNPASEAENCVAAAAQRNFDVSRSLSTCSLYRLGDREHVFAWTYHHVLADSWTLRFIMDEFCALYATGDAADLHRADAAAGPGYSDYARWVTSGDHGPEIRYWRAYLAGVPPLRRSPEPRLLEPPNERRETVFRLTGTSLDHLEQARRRHRVTANTVLLAMWALAALEATRAPIALIGCVVFGRGVPVKGIGAIAGVCANVVPVRIEAQGSLASILGRLQRDVLTANARSHLALGDVMATAGLSRDDLDSIVNFTIDRQDVSASMPAAANLELRNIRYVQASDYDVYLDIELAVDAIGVTVNFASRKRHYETENLRCRCADVLRRIAEAAPNGLLPPTEPISAPGQCAIAEFEWSRAGRP